MVQLMEALSRIKEIYEDEITLKVDPSSLYELHGLDPNEEYVVKIEKKGKARTLEQNRYLWKLINEIGRVQQGRAVDDTELYCDLLEKANVKWDIVEVIPQAEQRLRDYFRRIRFLDTDGYKNQYKVYYGSSKFNTKEMSELIEAALDWAEDAGIPQAYWRDLLE